MNSLVPALEGSYDGRLVALSIVIAILAAGAALGLAGRVTVAREAARLWWLSGGAIAMGIVIWALHYIGMAAVSFVPMALDPADLRHSVGITGLGVVGITTVTVGVLGLVFLTSTIERRFSIQARALQSSARRFRSIVESALDSFLEIDSTGRLTDWNACAERTFGWSRAEALGRTIDSLIVIGGGDSGVRWLHDIFHSPGDIAATRRIGVTARHRDGHEFPVEITLTAIDSGERSVYTAFIHDITPRKLVEKESEAAKTAAEAGSRAKSEFLANMSHEIRTPMNGVIGMTELLLDTQLEPMQRDYAENIRDSGTALLTVINDILDFSKVEAGKLELENLDVDLRDTFEDVARLLSLQAHAKGLEVTAQIDPTLPDLVKADAGRVRQILLNLAGNAVKFTKQGEVALEIKVIGSGERGTHVRCEVRDTGIGIPLERQKALFTPFTQADASTTRHFGGTGLGLSIVRRLAELMGGEAGIESRSGPGSTFWFTAWFATAAAPAQRLRLAPAELKGQRVIMVDDNATNRKVLMGQLMQCGVDPMSAGSADEAVALMRQAAAAGRSFGAALLDHQMPECDGAELGRMIIADPKLKSTHLVLLTSSGQRGDGQLFADIGFAGYLLKPVTHRDLTDCLMLIFGTGVDTWRTHSVPIVTRHALRARRARSRILLAEDNAVNQKVATRMLQKMDCRVTVVDDGAAAVSAWQTGDFDLILMDCQMPHMDGYEATSEIRRIEAGKHRVPIVALTADAMKGADEKCRAAGMDDYLTKPIDSARLEACLERFLAEAADSKEATADAGG